MTGDHGAAQLSYLLRLMALGVQTSGGTSEDFDALLSQLGSDAWSVATDVRGIVRGAALRSALSGGKQEEDGPCN